MNKTIISLESFIKHGTFGKVYNKTRYLEVHNCANLTVKVWICKELLQVESQITYRAFRQSI